MKKNESFIVTGKLVKKGSLWTKKTIELDEIILAETPAMAREMAESKFLGFPVISSDNVILRQGTLVDYSKAWAWSNEKKAWLRVVPGNYLPLSEAPDDASNDECVKKYLASVAKLKQEVIDDIEDTIR
jgi:hypothetical protein